MKAWWLNVLNSFFSDTKTEPATPALNSDQTWLQASVPPCAHVGCFCHRPLFMIASCLIDYQPEAQQVS